LLLADKEDLEALTTAGKEVGGAHEALLQKMLGS
jgi:hypothetical protein